MRISRLPVWGIFLVVLVFAAMVKPVSAALPITTCQELQNIQANLSGDYYLAGDIDCSDTATWNGGEGFRPIGSLGSPFTGRMDGRGYSVDDLYMNKRSDGYDYGLFGYVDGNALIQNIGLKRANVTGAIGVGGLVGTIPYYADVTIRNCYVEGSVSGGYFIGGFVGYLQSGTIKDSYSTAQVSGSQLVGGFVGLNVFALIENSFATGNVSSTYNGDMGGFVGVNEGTIRHCFATGNVDGKDRTGGFAGTNEKSGSIVGPIGVITDCYALGNVTGHDKVGGFAGENRGGTEGSTTYVAVLRNCYSAGTVTGTSNAGGFLGVAGNNQQTVDCFWDTGTSGQATSAGGTGKTTAEMRQKSTFTNWDFKKTWGITEAVNFPYLVEPRTANRMIAFVYNTDSSGADNFKTLLQDRGYFVRLVQKSAVPGHNLGQYQLIVISSDTGSGYDWGTDDQVGAIAPVDVPILGLGYGGGSFFQEMGLSINWENGWISFGLGGAIHVPKPNHCLFLEPNSITIPGSRVIELYTGSGFLADEKTLLDPKVTLFGRQESDETHYILVQEGKDFLWGFAGDPSIMTPAGEDLFHNLVQYLSAGCAPEGMFYFIPNKSSGGAVIYLE